MPPRKKKNAKPAMLNGQKWRASHQATVDAILGSRVRTVTSKGDAFYNVDSWVARSFAAAMCEWAELNPRMTPTRRDIEGWVAKANNSRISTSEKGITIAQTPDDLPRWLAFALVGGGYHEAWHTQYSRTKALHVNEVVGKVLAMWKLIPHDPTRNLHGWKGLTGALLTWSNIIEDIRIERIGCREFPGAGPKMEALQDLILKQEREGRQAAAHRGLPTNSDLNTVMGAFRDIGLGYKTDAQDLALHAYKEGSPKAWAFVTAGPLKPLLDQSIELKASDDLESLWLAMAVVAEISITATKPPPPPQPKPQPKKGEAGEGDPQPGSGESDPGEGGKESKSKPKVYKVGDRAKLKTGGYAGREVEVTRAGLPDDKGRQELEFALVEA
tara:strand:- start:1163 stop:2317 length:1155 start_codon:yes stop_codon:yes gene_type:complete